MDRPTAKEDMKDRVPRILDVYSKDLDVVKVRQRQRLGLGLSVASC